jgi:hypothetical protein
VNPQALPCRSPTTPRYETSLRSTRTLTNGQTRHVHSAVTPALVAPGQATVFPLPPAFVTPQDGHLKQDCELAASARWLPQWAPRLAALGPITFLGDDLYCHQPFCEQVLAQHGHFLFVCLPQSHPTLYEWLADFERQGPLPSVVTTRWTGTQRLTDTYRYFHLSTFPSTPGMTCLTSCWRVCGRLRASPEAGQIRGKIKFGIAVLCRFW